jgi:hypothetical protein
MTASRLESIDCVQAPESPLRGEEPTKPTMTTRSVHTIYHYDLLFTYLIYYSSKQ